MLGSSSVGIVCKVSVDTTNPWSKMMPVENENLASRELGLCDVWVTSSIMDNGNLVGRSLPTR